MTRRLVLGALVAAALTAPALAAAQPAPVTWCGTDETAQDRVPDLELSAAEQVRVVYAIPSDGTDAFLADASGIATDAAWIDEWWQSQDPTRAPRFDRYPFPGCTSKFGQLDIGFRRLPNPTAYYEAASSPSLRLDRDLRGAFPESEKTIVYFDGPVTDPETCGVTDYLSDRDGGDLGIVYVFLQSGCNITPTGSGGSAEVAAHELTHNLGAVPADAPNECPDSASHVCDSTVDLMYPFLGDESTLDSVQLDVGRDDYYARDGGMWDVQDSSWLSHLPQFPFSLTVRGSGSVTAQAGAVHLPCDAGCSGLSLDDGTTVSVRAVPARGWTFSSWSGGCGGVAPSCAFSLGAPADAAATFVRAPLRVTVSLRGRGSVSSAPSGVSCPGACKASFAAGARVRLVAQPARGWKLSSWGGACRGRGACTVTATGAARATFVRR